MEKLPQARVQRYITLLCEAEKDLATQEWWTEKDNTYGVPLATVKEIREFFTDNFTELSTK